MVKNSRDLKKITLEDKVYNTIVQNNLIQNNDKIVIGVSGGPDSICLLYVLNNLKEQFITNLGIAYEIIVAHVNHGIRQESKEEAIYVEDVCKKLGVDFNFLEADIPSISKEQKISEEMCGRKVRYDFFNKIKEEKNASKIAVAHNADDETIILNLSRGTGLKGLTGISYQNDNIVRPLLDIKKSEILEYCKKYNLNPRIDKTNFEDIYLRNKVRINIIPVLEENLGESFLTSVLKTREILLKEEEFLSQYTNNIISSAIIENNKKGIVFKFDNILKEHDAIILRCIRCLILECVGNLESISNTHTNDISNMLKNNHKGKMFVIGNKFKIEILKKNVAIIVKLGEKV